MPKMIYEPIQEEPPSAIDLLKRFQIFRRTSRNTVELDVGRWTILLSYGTPVAATERLTNITELKYMTDYPWSLSTTRHIRKFFKGSAKGALHKPQEWFNSLIKISIDD